MSNDFNLMLSEDLAEVSGPIMDLLIKGNNFNLRGMGALLYLVSGMMAERVGSMPSDEDRKVARTAILNFERNPLATISFMVQLAKGFIMVHHGYGRKNGQV